MGVKLSYMWEQHDMGLQQRNGNVPGIVSLAQEFYELRGQLGLGLAEADALQQSLQAHDTIVK